MSHYISYWFIYDSVNLSSIQLFLIFQIISESYFLITFREKQEKY